MTGQQKNGWRAQLSGITGDIFCSHLFLWLLNKIDVEQQSAASFSPFAG
jgi:hypothetical protein